MDFSKTILIVYLNYKINYKNTSYKLCYSFCVFSFFRLFFTKTKKLDDVAFTSKKHKFSDLSLTNIITKIKN